MLKFGFVVSKSMLFPRKTKYKKMHKRDRYRKEYAAIRLVRGEFGIKALSSGRLSAKQLESCRKAMIKKMRRIGKILFRIFPDAAITSKPAEVRMGKGKGSLDYWCSNVKSGRVLFEFQGVSRSAAFEAAKLASVRLPVKTKFVI